MRRGKRISIPLIEESSTNCVVYGRINKAGLSGRPTNVVLKVIDLGIARKWFLPQNLWRELLFLGLDRGYITPYLVVSLVWENGHKKELETKQDALNEEDENACQ